MKKLLLLIVLIVSMVGNNVTAENVLTPELLYSLTRVSNVQISPNGKYVLFSETNCDLKANKMHSKLYLLDLTSKNKVEIAKDLESKSDIIFSPNGEDIAFVASDKDGNSVYVTNILKNKAKRLFSFKDGINNLKYSPDGRYFSFIKDVKTGETVADKYPQCDQANVRIFNSLPIREWDYWLTENSPHIFYIPVGATAKDAVDIMKDGEYVFEYRGYNWSPDSKEIAYSTKKMTGVALARSTNSDVYVYNLETKKTDNITTENKGYDDAPSYSPDGRYIAYKSQERPGFESDRIRLMLYNRKDKGSVELTKNFPNWVDDFLWKNNNEIFFNAPDSGAEHIFRININTLNTERLVNDDFGYGNLSYANSQLVFTKANINTPDDIYCMNTDNKQVQRLTALNDEKLKGVTLSTFERKWMKTRDGKDMMCWIIYPPNFDKNKKYPMLTYCQGGPQQMVGQAWGYRWNMSLLTARGYVMVAPNRRGCPGFGQDWIDAITHDWGGNPMNDILDATDEMCKISYIDKDRLAALGASAGGFTTFWLAGNHNKRFKAFLSHCGVFNFYSMYGATEELFFPDWEWYGPYWETGNKWFYEKNSPHNFIQNWDTPIIISTGEYDFRVPYTQSLEAFTAAQVKGVPSELLVYPEMTHFIFKAQEYVVWYNEVFNFFDKYVKNNR